MITSITRVGVVAKHRLQPAVKVLVALAAWLDERGIKVVDGMGMFAHQGALSFELLTGKNIAPMGVLSLLR